MLGVQLASPRSRRLVQDRGLCGRWLEPVPVPEAGEPARGVLFGGAADLGYVVPSALDGVTSWTVNTGQSGTVRDQRLSECVQMTRGCVSLRVSRITIGLRRR